MWPPLGTWPTTQACALTGMELVTLWFAAHAQSTEPHQPGPMSSIFKNSRFLRLYGLTHHSFINCDHVPSSLSPFWNKWVVLVPLAASLLDLFQLLSKFYAQWTQLNTVFLTRIWGQDNIFPFVLNAHLDHKQILASSLPIGLILSTSLVKKICMISSPIAESPQIL